MTNGGIAAMNASWQPKGGGRATPQVSGRAGWSGGGGAAVAGSHWKRLAVIALALGLGIVTIGAAVWLLWQPTPDRPVLVAISGSYAGVGLPANGSAADEADRLRDDDFRAFLNTDLDTGRRLPADLGDDAFARLPVQDRLYGFWRNNTTGLLYLNAVGLAGWNDSLTPEPVLLPDGFAFPKSTLPQARFAGAVPLERILDAFAAGRPQRKLVVLDAQRIDHDWSLGILANDFTRLTEELVERRDDGATLRVIVATGPDGFSRADPLTGRSAFFDRFARGVFHDGDDPDGKSSLAELMAELADADSVAGWTDRNRAEGASGPRLLPAAAADARPQWRFGTVGKVPELRPLPDERLAQPAAGIETAWRQFLERDAAQPDGRLLDPLRWRVAEEALLRAERLWIDGAVADCRDAAAQAAVAVAALSPPPVDVPAVASVGMLDRYLDPQDRRRASFDDLLARIRSGTADEVPLDGAPPLVRDIEDAVRQGDGAVVPSELFLYLMLREEAAEGPQGHGRPNVIAERTATLVALQARGERLAAGLVVDGDQARPATFGYQLLDWYRPLVEAGDRSRRQAIDLTVGHGLPLVPIGQDAPAVPEDREAAYEAAVADAEKSYASAERVLGQLDDVWRTHRQALYDLPWLCRLAGARDWSWQTGDLNGSLENHHPAGKGGYADAVDELLRSTAALGRRLRGTRPEGDTETVVRALAEAAAGTDRQRHALRERVVVAATYLSSGPQRTGVVWRQIELALAVPFSVTGADPATAAANRLKLLGYLRDEVGAAGVKAKPAESNLDRARRVHPLAMRLYGLPAGAGAGGQTHGSAVLYGLDVVRRGHELVALATDESQATTPAGQWTQYVLEGYLRDALPKLPATPADIERASRRAFLDWHAGRVLTDGWYRLDRNDPRPYYATAADLYRPSSEAGDRGRDDAEMTVHGPTGPLVFDGGSGSATVQGRLEPGDAWPAACAGWAYLAVPADADAGIGVGAPTPGDRPRTVAYPLTAADGREGSRRLRFVAAFRGRRPTPAPVAVEQFDPDAGPALRYDNSTPPQPQLLVKSTAARKTPHIVFLLDCSQSMGNDDRMDELRRVLKTFLEAAQGTSLRIGVRLLGVHDQQRAPSDPRKFNVTADSMHADMDPHLDVRELIGLRDLDAVRGELLDLLGQGDEGPLRSHFSVTPLFFAVADALESFPAGEDRSQPVLVVVSDGGDYFFDPSRQHRVWDAGSRRWRPASGNAEAKLDRATAPVLEILAKRRDPPRILAFGFENAKGKFTHMRQLVERIDAAGVAAEFVPGDADDLIEKLLQQAGVPKLTIRNSDTGEVVAGVKDRPFSVRNAVESKVAPQRIDLLVADPDGGKDPSGRKGVVLRPHQVHRLSFENGRLAYRVEGGLADGRTIGAGPWQLGLLDSHLTRDGGRLDLRLAFWNTADETWHPGRGVRVRVRRSGEPTPSFALDHPTPNATAGGGGFGATSWQTNHYPAWSLVLDGWAKGDKGEVEVRIGEELAQVTVPLTAGDHPVADSDAVGKVRIGIEEQAGERVVRWWLFGAAGATPREFAWLGVSLDEEAQRRVTGMVRRIHPQRPIQSGEIRLPAETPLPESLLVWIPEDDSRPHPDSAALSRSFTVD